MGVTQIGRQAVKPTALGELSRGIQNYQQQKLQRQLMMLRLKAMQSQIGLQGAQQKKQAAQAEQLAAVSKLLQGTSLGGEFEPTFGPSGVTLKPIPKPAASERKAIAETEASLDALNNLKKLFESPQTEVGPLIGRASPTLGLIGKTTQEQENLMAATAAFKNRIIKEITGAQMSETEAKRIMKQVPDITDPPVRWLAKWNQTVKNLKSIRKRREEILKASGVKVPTTTYKTRTGIKANPITKPNFDKYYNSLPKGAKYTAPDGTKRTKQ